MDKDTAHKSGTRGIKVNLTRFHLNDIKKMNIKDATLRVYLHNIREKLNIKTTEDLIKYSIIIINLNKNKNKL